MTVSAIKSMIAVLLVFLNVSSTVIPVITLLQLLGKRLALSVIQACFQYLFSTSRVGLIQGKEL